jgi:hypothetical protein
MQKQFAIGLLVFAAWLASSADGYAQTSIVTRCTGIEGYAYYVEGPLVEKKNSGWQKDGLKDGSFLVTRTGDGYDIIYVDAANRTVSTREDGGTVVAIVDKPDALVLVTAYAASGLSEMWTFRLNESGRGTMMHSMHRHGGGLPIERYSLMRAQCSR